jgi:hypothetical protein
MTSATGAKDEGGNALLMKAAGAGNAEEVAALLASGADVNARNGFGTTALMAAAQKGHAPIVSLLLAAHADIDAADRAGNTALTWANAGRHEEVVALLADRGAGRKRRREVVVIYSHRPDEVFVRKLAADLEARVHDVRVFYDYRMDPAASWSAVMATKLSNANMVLMVASTAFFASVAGEQERNHVAGLPPHRCLLALVSACTIPESLRRYDTVDFSGSYDAGLRKLANILTVRRTTFARGITAGLLVGAVVGKLAIDQWMPGATTGALLGGAFLGSFGEALLAGKASDGMGGSLVFGTVAGTVVAASYRPWSWSSMLIPVAAALVALCASGLGFMAGRMWSKLHPS